jgi:hypothetical protein
MVIQARKRFVVALVVALFLAAFAVAASAQVAMPSGCKGLEPWSFDWIMRQCYIYMAVPSDFAHRPFLVR